MLSFGLLETRLYDQAEKAAMAVRFASRLLMHTNVLRHAAGAHSRKDSGTFQVNGAVAQPLSTLLQACPHLALLCRGWL